MQRVQRHLHALKSPNIVCSTTLHAQRTLMISTCLLSRQKKHTIPRERIPHPSFLEEYDIESKNHLLKRSKKKSSKGSQKIDLVQTEFTLEEEPLTREEKKMLDDHMKAKKIKALPASSAMEPKEESSGSKALTVQHANEQRDLHEKREAASPLGAPLKGDSQTQLIQAEANLALNRHESHLLKNGHRELTLKLKVLYHKLHCANVISLNILNKKDRSLVHLDRRIEKMLKDLTRLQAIRKDNERIIARNAKKAKA